MDIKQYIDGSKATKTGKSERVIGMATPSEKAIFMLIKQQKKEGGELIEKLHTLAAISMTTGRKLWNEIEERLNASDKRLEYKPETGEIVELLGPTED